MSDFYIGWSGASGTSRKFMTKFYYSFLGLMLLLVVLFTWLERPFSNSMFAYGEQIELEGYLIENPVIALRIKNGDQFEILPLVGFGKMGPHAALVGLLGGNYHIQVRGTLISHKGKRFLELTDGRSAVLSSRTSGEMDHTPTLIGAMKIKGEIMDPKCFFGVMKPGYGKVHRSCAIRCISGEIPPVLAIRNGDDFDEFYFLTDMEGKMLKEDLLSYVGKSITISGNAFEIDSWKSISLESLEVSATLPKVTNCI
ncbi:MAG: hypothetical protein ABJP45_15170 [Cyclobacteriaceae bacterium]